MLLVVNHDWGGFTLPEDYAAVKTNGWLYDDDWDTTRQDQDLIDIVLSDDYDGDLAVVEIPNDATDYTIQDYDGMESVIYVQNGKLHWADRVARG